MFCNQCGARVPDDSRFCSSCGAKLSAVQSVQPRNDSYFDIRHGVLVKYRGREKNVVVPAGVVEIEKDAFTDYGMESLTIPEGCTKVEINTRIKKIYFPTTIEQFDLSSNGYENLPADTIYFSSGTKVVSGNLHYHSYSERSAFVSVHLPNSVTKLRIGTDNDNLRFFLLLEGSITEYHSGIRAAIWRYQDKCQHCGGSFKGGGGFINPIKCRICKMKKDYIEPRNGIK